MDGGTESGGGAQREQVPAQHVLSPFGLGGRDIVRVGVRTVRPVPAHTRQLRGDAQTGDDAFQHGVGEDLAAGQDLADLGLGLPGQGRDTPLRQPHLIDQCPVDGTEVVVGQRGPDVVAPVHAVSRGWGLALLS